MAGGNLDTVVALGHPATPACFPHLCALHHQLAFAENLLHAGLSGGTAAGDTYGPIAPALTFCLEFMCSSRAFVHSFTHSFNKPSQARLLCGRLGAAGDTAVKEADLLGRADVLVAAEWAGNAQTTGRWVEGTALGKASLRRLWSRHPGGEGGLADVWGDVQAGGHQRGIM